MMRTGKEQEATGAPGIATRNKKLLVTRNNNRVEAIAIRWRPSLLGCCLAWHPNWAQGLPWLLNRDSHNRTATIKTSSIGPVLQITVAQRCRGTTLSRLSRQLLSCLGLQPKGSSFLLLVASCYY